MTFETSPLFQSQAVVSSSLEAGNICKRRGEEKFYCFYCSSPQHLALWRLWSLAVAHVTLRFPRWRRRRLCWAGRCWSVAPVFIRFTYLPSGTLPGLVINHKDVLGSNQTPLLPADLRREMIDFLLERKTWGCVSRYWLVFSHLLSVLSLRVCIVWFRVYLAKVGCLIERKLQIKRGHS